MAYWHLFKVKPWVGFVCNFEFLKRLKVKVTFVFRGVLLELNMLANKLIFVLFLWTFYSEYRFMSNFNCVEFQMKCSIVSRKISNPCVSWNFSLVGIFVWLLYKNFFEGYKENIYDVGSTNWTFRRSFSISFLEFIGARTT